MADPRLTTFDLADRLATSRRHIRHLIYGRQIPCVKAADLERFDAGKFIGWADSQGTSVHATGPSPETKLESGAAHHVDITASRADIHGHP